MHPDQTCPETCTSLFPPLLHHTQSHGWPLSPALSPLPPHPRLCNTALAHASPRPCRCTTQHWHMPPLVSIA
eukprot:354056-Chlamydomonas_euryale.AAC.4